MLLLHQTGNNYKWNIQSFTEDHIGDGLILSPINTSYKNLEALPKAIIEKSVFDPQLLMPSNGNGKLTTYPYFPTSILPSYRSTDYESIKKEIARQYTQMIIKLGFKKIIIPNRYSDIESSTYLENIQSNFIEPYCNEIPSSLKIAKYLTIFVNKTRLIDDEARDTMLDWITGLSEIDGIYLIFDIKRTTKQIKDVDILAEALFFVKSVESSGKRVIIGFTNTEGILFSIAGPEAITCGSYENLRNFSMSISRFAKKEKEKKGRRGPNARLYSAVLIQWIEYNYVKALVKNRYSRLYEIFADSKYRPLFFEPTYNWHFGRSELYKHFFIEIDRQVKDLPDDLDERKNYLLSAIKNAITIYEDIAQSGILLDSDSNGTHLNGWFNAITIYDRLVRERL